MIQSGEKGGVVLCVGLLTFCLIGHKRDMHGYIRSCQVIGQSSASVHLWSFDLVINCPRRVNRVTLDLHSRF